MGRRKANRTRLQNCEIPPDPNDSTWFFFYNVPDLANADYHLDNRARSVVCEPNGS